VAQARQAGFDRATSLAASDIDRRFAADQSNQGVDLNVAGTNASLAQQAALANAAAVNDASRFKATQEANTSQINAANEIASAGLRANNVQLLAGLSQDQLKDLTDRAGLLSAVGDAQQAQDQAVLNADIENFWRGQDVQVAGQNLRTAALAGVPVPTTTRTTGSSTVTEKDPARGLSNIIKIASMIPYGG
jgi:hypothetical protein